MNRRKPLATDAEACRMPSWQSLLCRRRSMAFADALDGLTTRVGHGWRGADMHIPSERERLRREAVSWFVGVPR